MAADDEGTLLLLKSVFLSPDTRTDGPAAVQATFSGKALTQKHLNKMMRESVDGYDGMLDRTGSTPISTFIFGTYQRGLPVYDSCPSIQEHTISAIRFIFEEMARRPAQERRVHLTKLAEAYQACQAVQGRVIDAIYGSVSGRDGSLKGFFLAILDEEKQRVLDELTHKLHPDAALQGDECPQKQFPHVQNAYRVALARQYGIRGLESAEVDSCKPQLSAAEAVKGESLYWDLFDVASVADAVVADVNQPNSAPGGRRIPRDMFAKWAGDVKAADFNPHHIYFQEEREKEYNGRPAAGEEYEPFLNRAIALTILRIVFTS